MPTNKEQLIEIYLAAIEEELKLAVELADYDGATPLYRMLAFHMGWQGKSAQKKPHGKRIRPLLALLSCAAAGGDWKKAMPAAVAVELVHNFSLIHDDIEDHSPVRRNRPTVWKKWGIPQAINAGDAMFTLAHLQSVRLKESVSISAALKAVQILQHSCLRLTQGQYLDLAYEKSNDVSIEDYWSMVDGKTATLISASTELGAIAAFSNEGICASYSNFGRLFGLAFQVQDDILGIWGNSALTGKSTQSDLITKKKTLPVLYGLSRNGKFAERWHQGPIHVHNIDEMIALLENDGGKVFAQSEATRLIDNAINVLDDTHPVGEAGQILKEITISLADRKL